MKRIAPRQPPKTRSARVPKRETRVPTHSFRSLLAVAESKAPATAALHMRHPRRETQRETLEMRERSRDALLAEPQAEAPAPLAADEFIYNSVLIPPTTTPSPPAAPVPQTSALERAQAAALAERVLHSVQVGRVQGGHLVRLRLSSEVEVELRHVDGVLQATVVGEGDQGPLARRLDGELRARGLRFDRVELG